MEAYFIFFLCVCAVCLVGYCIEHHIRSMRKGRSFVNPPEDNGNYNLYKQRATNNALYYKQYKKFRKSTEIK